MKVAGFTIARNAIKYDYPVVEAIKSILPVCDAVFVAVGQSEDDTENLIRSIGDDKIHIINTVWDDSLRQGGKVLAVETNKAFGAIPDNYDWAFYIQADEVLHEKYIETINFELQNQLHNKAIEGLLFNYKHFYGSYDYVGESYKWYRREIRIVRNDKSIYSHGDAQGFRKNNDEKLNVKLIDAYIYHYGWVKDPRKQQAKQLDFNRLWHDDKWIESNIAHDAEFDYSEIDSLSLFDSTHPKVMLERIEKMNWKFSHDISKKNYSPKEKIKRFIESLTGYRIGEYKNYKIVK
ncbi:MAG: glycosyltransferase family 2 protein [Candidatus Kapabacteria bacterium]|nr:glycosyltransferase family 2 protein [Candidatus Kapabacteria bacterium]